MTNPRPRHLDRREMLAICAAAGGALLASCHPLLAEAAMPGWLPELMTRPIPSSGERLPVIGIGTARRYDVGPAEGELGPLRDVLREFPKLGGRLIDTAPGYGRAEAVSAQLINELGLRKNYFIATKVSAGGRGGRAAAMAEMDRSLGLFKTDQIDLMQVWNLNGAADTLPLLREWKDAKKIRYYGVTTSSDAQYTPVETLLKNEKMDFVQVDYAIDNRGVEDRILPLAQEKGVAVLINGPFGRGRVLTGFANKEMPGWAREIGITSWPQFALKWIVGHPAVTAAIPGTAQMKYLTDNMTAAQSPLPDDTMRKKMLAFFDAN